MMTRRVSLVACAVLLLAATAASAQQSITYQGQLKQSGAPFTGTPDLEFRLYDSLTGGTQIGPALTRPGWPVEDGLFQVELDFGAGVFEGSPSWLEIVVNGTTLSPRQSITPAPIALFSLDSAGGGSPPVWSVNRSAAYYTAGNVGIGTSAPLAPLDLRGNSSIATPQLRIVENQDDYARMTFDNDQGTGRFWTIAALTRGGSASPDRLNLFHSSSGDVLSATGQGRVGIGILDPSTTLDVDGDLRVRALAHGESQPRRLRVDTDGQIVSRAGLGFIAVPASGLVAGADSSQYVIGPGFFWGDSSEAFSAWFALDAIPHEAALTELRFWAIDSSSEDLDAELVRCSHDGSSCQSIATVSSTGSLSARRSFSTSSFSHAVIDQQNYNYQLEVTGNPWDGSSTRFTSARISFLHP